MEILCDSIKTLDNLFNSLTLSMHGANYQVLLEGKSFRYDNLSWITIVLLRALYHDDEDIAAYPIEGSVNKAFFETAKQHVEECIKTTYYGDPQGYKETINSKIAKRRLDTFWDIINAHFTMPPTHCFEHKPEHDSFFGGGVMWEFCYILLNDNTKEGIVIAGQAYD